MAGGKVLLVNEFIKEAVNSYRSNWKSTKIICKDIREITPEFILSEANIEKYELDVMDGSPPCSAFSTAGKRDKNWGKIKKYSDTTQDRVEDLFFEYIRMLRGIMPKVFIAENVAGLAKGVAKGYLNEILRNLKESGYYVECKILDARFLGVPQSRARVIFVGVRNDLMKKEYQNNLHPKPLNYTIPLKDAFKNLDFTLQDSIDTNMEKYAMYKKLVLLKQGETHNINFSLIKTSPNKVSPCLTAFTGSISAAKICHWDNRGFTIKEAKRIMSVPDDYILTGTYAQQMERLGRMVAPFMMKSIVENLLKIGVL